MQQQLLLRQQIGHGRHRNGSNLLLVLLLLLLMVLLLLPLLHLLLLLMDGSCRSSGHRGRTVMMLLLLLLHGHSETAAVGHQTLSLLGPHSIRTAPACTAATAQQRRGAVAVVEVVPIVSGLAHILPFPSDLMRFRFGHHVDI